MMGHKSPEAARRYKKEYLAKNREKVREYGRAYYLAHAEQKKAYAKKYRLATLERIPAVKKAYRAANLEKVKAWQRRWRDANTEKVRVINRAWRVANPGSNRASLAKRRTAERANTVNIREVREFYKAVASAETIRCFWCKRPVPKRERHVDHIIPVSKGGLHATSNLCCACRDCNYRKSNHLPGEFSAQGVLL